jgi:hypothetical protein
VNQLDTTIPGLSIFFADYRSTNAEHFDINRFVLRDEINNALQLLRNGNIAVVQADVIGHSMGGILSRLWAGDDMYKQSDNFAMGNIHKLLTIDSPHLGSFAADLIGPFVDLDSSSLRKLSPDERALLLSTAHEMGVFLTPEGALGDLRSSSQPLRNMNAKVITVPSHAVVGNFSGPFDLSQSPVFPGLFRLLKFFGFNPILPLPTMSDLLVSVQSQQGGLLPLEITEFDDTHTGILKNPDVVTRAILPFLNTPSDDAFFAMGFPTQ